MITHGHIERSERAGRPAMPVHSNSQVVSPPRRNVAHRVRALVAQHDRAQQRPGVPDRRCPVIVGIVCEAGPAGLPSLANHVTYVQQVARIFATAAGLRSWHPYGERVDLCWRRAQLAEARRENAAAVNHSRRVDETTTPVSLSMRGRLSGSRGSCAATSGWGVTGDVGPRARTLDRCPELARRPHPGLLMARPLRWLVAQAALGRGTARLGMIQWYS
jgi:hypothetical protein